MSRTLYLSLDEGKVVARCLKEKVGVSAIERLPRGGVRLVCMSSDGAERIRRALKSHLLDEDGVARERHRPSTPLW
ncbi:hypothetical protein [Sphingomonas sp. URHD0057]|uniref:hypothetical protein n=1 Tax=Sphingomonas sp. URHD0057 TaxID=1380389 RepID=UPI00048DBCE3|nr:hypothetical protein [Sphingomonas sp. URHD0057]